ncbi:MAG: hypothetical protein H6825_12440 [Planctomycetes bacterium]|nr:hypothetical protein [Planctomycetota bacterium]
MRRHPRRAAHVARRLRARDTTPALAACFAARGTLFTTANAPLELDAAVHREPAHGLPPNTHGVLGDGRDWLMDALSTWPERLRAAGIAGAAFAGNPLVSPSTNFDQGFAHFESDPGTGLGDADAESLDARLLAWIDGQPATRALVRVRASHGPARALRSAARARALERGLRRAAFVRGHLPGMLQHGQIPPLEPDEQAHVGDLYDAELSYLDECFAELQDALDARAACSTAR